jgi:SAM-dependent methyltransferase
MTPGELYRTFLGNAGADRIVAFLAFLFRRAELPSQPRVLDMGAGTGRLIDPLRALGCEVEGREPRATYRACHPAVTEGDFATLEDRERFDAVIAVNDPFWYILDPSARADALARVFRALRPGGLLFLDGPAFRWILQHYRAPADEVTDGVRRSSRHVIDHEARLFRHIDTFEGEGFVEHDEHVFAMLDREEVDRLLERAGFTAIERFASYDDRAPRVPDGARMLFSARKA